MYETYKKKDAIDSSLFIKVLKVFFALLAKNIVEKGYIYRLPKGLGAIGIMKTHVGIKKVLNYPHYKKTGEKKYNLFRPGEQPFMAFWK